MAISKRAAVATAVALLLGAAGAAFGFSTVDVPTQSDAAVSVGAAPEVFIDDPDDVLSEQDEADMRAGIERMDRPQVVKRFHYMVFENNRENVLDTVEEYMRSTHPDEIGHDRMADGTMIIGVGLNPRQAFGYYGDDVAAELAIDYGQRDAAVLDEMKPHVSNGNIPAGLFMSAKLAMDTAAAEEYKLGNKQSERNVATGFGGAAGLTLGGIGGAGYIATRRRRERNLEQVRSDFESVMNHHADLAQRLPEIDVRANSLSSELADAELRKQWGEVRDQFLKNHEVINAPGGIGEVQISDDADALKNRRKLREAAQSIIYVSTAEDNINRLFNIEQGDPATRRAGLTDLREDVIQAKHTATDSGLKEDLERLERRIDELDGDPTSPAFLDDFVRVLGDYRLLLEQVREKEFSDVKEYTPLPSPAIYEPNYTYSGFTTFAIMDSWHETNLQEHQRQQQAESSSTTPGVSSSGFSSAGSSSRF